MNERILFVDDDPNLLLGFERCFRRQFQLDTAEGGEAGLAKLAARGPFAVVIADRQMPGMDGIQFLTLVRQRAPDTVRLMLTGNANLEAAIKVVNEGNIFRFLTKPCPPDLLAKAVSDAQAQYRLVMAEKELLSKTLSGSIKLLSDILSIVDAASFGRAETIRTILTETAPKTGLENAWEVHLAAMLAPIGYVTLPAETVVKARAGQALSRVEEQLVTKMPEVAARLLANIPRLEGVARIVRYQQKHFDGTGFPPDDIKGESIPVGARLLKILLDMVQLQSAGFSRLAALDEMQARLGWYDPRLLTGVRAALVGTAAIADPSHPSVSVTTKDLKVGMVLRSNVETKDGILILSAGHRLNEMTLEKIQNFEHVSGIKEPIFVEAA